MGDGATGAEGRAGEGPGRIRKGATGRKGGRSPGGGKAGAGKPVRRQFHLGEETLCRLGVHCTSRMPHRDPSKVVDEVLLRWLRENGRGRELWQDLVARGLSPDTQEDRQDGAAA